MSSLLTSLPAWRMLDPLPVLARLDDDESDGEGEGQASVLAVEHQA
jgi:hypothetical protein